MFADEAGNGGSSGAHTPESNTAPPLPKRLPQRQSWAMKTTTTAIKKKDRDFLRQAR